MENPIGRKSLIIWSTISCTMLIFLIIKYNSLDQDYWKPIEVEKIPISTRFETCLSLAKALHEIQIELFNAETEMHLEMNYTDIFKSISKFEKVKNETFCKIQTLKYASIENLS